MIAALAAFIALALKVPPEARDLWYYVNGLVILVALGMIASDDRR